MIKGNGIDVTLPAFSQLMKGLTHAELGIFDGKVLNAAGRPTTNVANDGSDTPPLIAEYEDDDYHRAAVSVSTQVMAK